MTCTPALNFSFTSIDQLDEVTQALGWSTEYRQLEAGSFSSAFTVRQVESSFLIKEQSSRLLEVVAPAPVGMYVLAMVEGGAVMVNGQIMSSDHLFVQPPDSDFRATLPAGIKVVQMGVVAEQFETVIQDIAPQLLVPLGGVSTIATPAGLLTNIRQSMGAEASNASDKEAFHEEVVSSILSDIVAVAADHSQQPLRQSLSRARAKLTFDRAREYIEAHLSEPIQIPSLCHYAGATLRSLERIFAQELSISPQRYVKARRLNAARRQLLNADDIPSLRVTEVALKHGFSHLGRFAGEYFRYFGEQPRETLQNQ